MAKPPGKGDRYECLECCMAIEVVRDCECRDLDAVTFQCCGRDMIKTQTAVLKESSV